MNPAVEAHRAPSGQLVAVTVYRTERCVLLVDADDTPAHGAGWRDHVPDADDARWVFHDLEAHDGAGA